MDSTSTPPTPLSTTLRGMGFTRSADGRHRMRLRFELCEKSLLFCTSGHSPALPVLIALSILLNEISSALVSAEP